MDKIEDEKIVDFSKEEEKPEQKIIKAPKLRTKAKPKAKILEKVICVNCHYFDRPSPMKILGTCHIRSLPGEFPSRRVDDWCGEGKKK